MLYERLIWKLISVVARCGECGPGELESGAVCGTDGQDYESACALRQVSCSLVRRQGGSFSSKTRLRLLIFNLLIKGRSFQSSQLSLETAHTGPCKAPCPGMERLGQFQAFGVRATNFGDKKRYSSLEIISNNRKYLRTVYSWLLLMRGSDEEPGPRPGSGPAVLPGKVWSVLQGVKWRAARHLIPDPLLLRLHNIKCHEASYVLNNPILSDVVVVYTYLCQYNII